MATKPANRRTKRPSKKTVYHTVWQEDGWKVVTGKLKPGRGRPGAGKPVFQLVTEKLPYDSLKDVKKDMTTYGYQKYGVYLAHDSMGVARYGGRGDVFVRLASHKKRHSRELLYFSLYIIEDKRHEREVETAIIRAAGPQLVFNSRKVASGLKPGDIADYEPGTEFFERQSVGGRKKGK